MTEETKPSDAPNAAQGAAQGAAAGAAAGDSADRRPDEAAQEASGPSVEELSAQIAAMRDQLLRAVADADNTRKRAEREAADARAYAVAGFARDLLSVADNLGRALNALTPELRAGMGEAGRTLLDGVEITQRDLHATLTRHGVKPIPVAPGTPFDPNLHQAAAQLPSELPPGSIVQVFQDGWTLGDRTLRAAVVAVSAGGGRASAEAPAPGASVDTKV
jgi:molecular chaperone GrpE